MILPLEVVVFPCIYACFSPFQSCTPLYLVYLSRDPSLSICISICISICLFICLFIYLCVYLSISSTLICTRLQISEISMCSSTSLRNTARRHGSTVQSPASSIRCSISTLYITKMKRTNTTAKCVLGPPSLEYLPLLLSVLRVSLIPSSPP